MEPIVYLNGAFVPKDEARISPDDRGFLFADGVYEVIRAYGGRFFRKDHHLNRMLGGLAALRIAGPGRTDLERLCDELLERNRMTEADALVYLQVTRGAAPRLHAFPDPPVPATVYGIATPFKPKADASVGIGVVTEPDVRWARCDIKTVGLLANCLANQRAQELGAKEAIFVRDGVALEATASSFFGVFGGLVRTAPKTNYILPSITRDAVLELCQEHGIAWDEAPILLHDLRRAHELFIAGTTMEVMPVVRVDGAPVGDGRPGPVTRRIQELFAALVQADATAHALRA
jgi:D-alanine transaminase